MKSMSTVFVSVLFTVALTAAPLLAQEEPTSQPSAEGTEAAEPGGHEMMEAMCPMHLEGQTEVTVENTDNGAAMVFANAAQADELRQRVHRMAEFHNAHHGDGNPMGMPAAEATVQDTEFGARLLLTPQDPAQLDSLRSHLTAHQVEMSEGRCPMSVMWGAHGENEGAPGSEEAPAAPTEETPAAPTEETPAAPTEEAPAQEAPAGE